MSEYQNSLIYGKNSLERIVSIEVNESEATIFRELEDGTLDILKVPNRFWILAGKQYGPGWNRLAGDQFFKYGKQFTTFRDYYEAKKKLPYKEIYTIGNSVEALMVKDGYTYHKGLNHKDVSILSFDIETTGLEHNDTSKVILISNTFRKKDVIVRRLFCFADYANCAEMIDAWAAWVREIDPSIICGHNVVGYDFQYLNYCHKQTKWKLAGSPMFYNEYSRQEEPDYKEVEGILLGRCEKPITFSKQESKFRVDGSRDLHYHKVQVYGREIVDTMFLAYKYDIGRKYESYGLKKIIAQEGLEKKDRTFYDASKIRDNYNNSEELEKIKQYAEEDGDDSLALYDLMCPPFFYMTQMVPKPYQLMIESASGSQLNSIMVRSYLQDKHSVARASDAVQFEGALSNGFPGIYRNCLKWDVASLYPSIMLQYEVYSKEKDPKKHMIQLLKVMRDGRLKNKQLSKETGDPFYKHLDGSQKIILNSLYGFMGAPGLHYNHPPGAAEVTRIGREILTKAIKWATGEL